MRKPRGKHERGARNQSACHGLVASYQAQVSGSDTPHHCSRVPNRLISRSCFIPTPSKCLVLAKESASDSDQDIEAGQQRVLW